MAELHNSNKQDLAPECQPIVLALDAYYDNELNEEERKGVEQHLLSCESCKRSLEATKQVSAALQSMPKAEMKRDMSNELDNLLKGSNNVVWLKRPLVAGSIAAAAAVAALALAPTMLPGIAPGNVANKPSVLNPVKPEQVTQSQPVTAKIEPQKTNNSQDKLGGTDKIAHDATTQQHPAPAHNETLPVQQKQDTHAIAEKPKATTPSASTQNKTQSTELVAKNDTPANPPSPAAAQVNVEATNKIAAKDNCDEIEKLAYFGDSEQSTMDVGISTDEDGLYAIKL